MIKFLTSISFKKYQSVLMLLVYVIRLGQAVVKPRNIITVDLINRENDIQHFLNNSTAYPGGEKTPKIYAVGHFNSIIVLDNHNLKIPLYKWILNGHQSYFLAKDSIWYLL
ncbi:unnamed protein product [Rhizopus microsporus]